MNTRRLKGMIVWLLAGLSLSVSPLAACVCSHEDAHEASEFSERVHHNQHGNSAASDFGFEFRARHQGCICIQPSPADLTQADPVVSPAEKAEPSTIFGSATLAIAKVTEVEIAFHFSLIAQRPFPAVTPSRGPPVL
jgi:hypothetical protein